MNDYLTALIYIGIGLSGAVGHYLKKRYLDNTTTKNLFDYIKGEPKATAKAVLSIVGAEIGLSLATGWPISLSAFVGALTAGYTADSAMNKAPDA